MEGGESPLEVLSRAATMLQETQQHRTTALADESKQVSTKQLPTTKWKKDRRSRAEYSRKSDPKFPESLGEYNSECSENNSSSQQSSLSTNGCNSNVSRNCDAPLDMSVRQRGLPPSYSQAISDPSFRSNYRSPVASNNSTTEEMPASISMCDPIIDEHFRRSLGKDYNAVFSNNNVPKHGSPPPKAPPKITTNVIELMDSTGLSVDDHFAKALGDTWFKLNNKDAEIKNNSSESVVTI